MSKNILCVFFIVFVLKTGISNSRISITLSQKGDNVILTCVLAGNESLTQVNWEMIQGSNHTKLGIFHPSQGIHIFSEHTGKVKIEGQQTPLASSGLLLQKEALNESGLVCCQFITFPSGSLEQCTDISEVISMLISPSQPHGAEQKQGLFGQFGALAVGCILSLLFLIIPIYTCQRCFCRRGQVLEIQHVYSDHSTFTEMCTEEAHEVHHAPPPSGFDPTKIYAKIKEDLFYGRLWKSYQGKSRVPTQGYLAGSKQIYHCLGENPYTNHLQMDQKHKPKIPDAMSIPPSDSSI